jgi:hypothetical protein
LQIRLFEHHDCCAPREFDKGQPEEQVIGERPDIGHPRNPLGSVLIQDLTGSLLSDRGLYEEKSATHCDTKYSDAARSQRRPTRRNSSIVTKILHRHTSPLCHLTNIESADTVFTVG